jgi:hypothetical protein
MPKMRDLGINVIPATMLPPECMPYTAGGQCNNFTHMADTGCGCRTNIQVSYEPAASTATCIPNSCGVACGCSHLTNPCLGCTLAPTIVNCVTHTTITICYTGSVCTVHSAITICHTGSGCPGGSICTGGTPTIITTTITPTTPEFQGGGLTRESIAQLKEQLQQQITQLDEHAKTLGPKTSDEIDAREKQLKTELADLASRRSDLKSK